MKAPLEFYKQLKFFKASEFKHPTEMEQGFLLFLDDVRSIYGKPLKITSDFRTATSNASASGSSSRSAHLLGRAVDIDTTYQDYSQHTKLMSAILKASLKWNVTRQLGLELVDSPKDSHIHFDLGGEFPDGYVIPRPWLAHKGD